MYGTARNLMLKAQIIPRDEHLCHRLTLPATEQIVDFHHQVIAYAGHTGKGTHW